ncbi:L,D-transpeptidase [Rhizobium halophytocola]|uniref:Lipoprotein-anchoring transpeptidase ErfK/SrfK n=1 Tax=Rhizobium halophytocola TaxID=735519 RepID=A0ABS4DWZ8_9HYPH|nr:L,D-transpeptidase [Rhizobium halophytocola]MBP1850221.1 lipoprotein-anchoring transpeptidase ErfK/SrfK [Rhizobium halophytocola]
MTFSFSRLFRRLFLVPLMVGLSGLSGCILVNDNSSMNVDTFQDQVSPVWYPPARNPPAVVQPVPEKRNLYQTQFHQTYGLPVASPVSRLYYGEVRDDDRTVPAVPVSRVDQRFLRQEVSYQTPEKPGTIVVDTAAHFLYLVQPDGKAMRYGVGLGRQGYAWKGRGVIAWKQKWPRWTPSDDMVSRQPDLRPVSASEGGMEAGLNNPLGARALYIYKDGKDTLYRVHGTPDWQSVGKATSSGCVRMFNQDVIDLYERVGAKAQIVVI